MSDELIVYWGARRVGVLWMESDGTLSFQYVESWRQAPNACPISLNLPLQEEPYRSNRALAFFSNLLPEANVRTLIARRLKISESNDFKLLEALGGDCAGALSLMPPDEPPPDGGRYELLENVDLERMIKEMPLRPLLSPDGDFRLSLAGAQDKLAVYVKDGRLFLPHGAKPSSHILKPAIARATGSVENEYFVTRVAHHAGLEVSTASIWSDPTPVFLSERYDREHQADGNLVRLHQEDFCQALGIDVHRKYESEGGPGLQACFDLIAKVSIQPALDKQRALQWVLFNYLVGNNDAHGKNIAFLFGDTGVYLAPFYDLISTAVYPDISQKLAMKVGDENRSEWLTRRHWERLAETAAVSRRIVFGLAKNLLKTFPPALAEAEQNLASLTIPLIGTIKKHVEARMRQLHIALESDNKE